MSYPGIPVECFVYFGFFGPEWASIISFRCLGVLGSCAVVNG